eukprot:scaffold27479_cov67-Isochrysis_galbana.AAC.1
MGRPGMGGGHLGGLAGREGVRGSARRLAPVPATGVCPSRAAPHRHRAPPRARHSLRPHRRPRSRPGSTPPLRYPGRRPRGPPLRYRPRPGAPPLRYGAPAARLPARRRAVAACQLARGPVVYFGRRDGLGQDGAGAAIPGLAGPPPPDERAVPGHRAAVDPRPLGARGAELDQPAGGRAAAEGAKAKGEGAKAKAGGATAKAGWAAEVEEDGKMCGRATVSGAEAGPDPQGSLEAALGAKGAAADATECVGAAEGAGAGGGALRFEVLITSYDTVGIELAALS